MATPPTPPTNEVNPLERDEEILELEPKSPQATQKVTLDLDDAPFLDDIEEEAPSEEEARPEAPETENVEDERKSGKSYRLALIIGGVVVALLLAGLAFWLTRPPPPPEPALSEPEPLQQPQPAPEPKPEEYTVDLKPFWVAYTQGEEVAFLSLRLTLTMEGSTRYVEVQRKEIILRDAIYYFLNNRPIPEIKREDAADALKADLMSVMNQHLSSPLNDILIKEYLVR
ncbi:flagellar basal body-associated FliL family protein [Desulfonatronum thiodismutans]|uniref:flagellar basal body-associated FliL family protein n=1 Tax=Desulfonatronum thiodismutans TaxID=159290 RepID=UPI0004ABDCA1|nr:flagellar basal body-associated FliL family protein [Desulfonatronum thiodismutans]